jgi:hypothetical protein
MPSRDAAAQDVGASHLSDNITTGSSPGITLLLLLAVLLPAISAFAILYRQWCSLPYQDDYAVILDFADNYHQLPTLKAKLLDVATAQTIEYKIIFEHFIVASEFELIHHINFALLAGLGDLFLFLTGYLLWRVYQEDVRDLNQRLLAFLPISLIFFSMTYWETVNWATADLQNLPVIFFSLLAVYLLFPMRTLASDRTHLVLACIAAAVATCCAPNAFLLGPVGLLILLPRRAYARCVVWCASFVLPLAFYLYHYSHLVRPVGRFPYFTRPLFFLAFFGAAAIPSRWPAAVVGVFILGVFWLAVRSRFDRINPAAFYFTVWIVGTGSMVAWGRGAAIFLIGSRYSIYSILTLIFCYAFLRQYLPNRWPTFNRRRFYAVCLALAAGMFVLANIHAYKKLGARRQMVLTGMELYRADPKVNSPMIDQKLLQGIPEEREYEQKSLTNAIQKHLYTLPAKQELR